MNRAYLHQQGVRQIVKSVYNPLANDLAELWVGIVKVRAADARLPPKNWSSACHLGSMCSYALTC